MSEKLENASQLHETKLSRDGLTDLQMHFLDRMQALVHQQAEYLQREEQDDFERKLISRAVYASLTDCVNSGVGDQAHAVLEASRRPGY